MAARVVLERVEGVEEAEVSFEAGSGSVTYDPAVTSPEIFIAELQRMTDFTARLADAGDTAPADPIQ